MSAKREAFRSKLREALVEECGPSILESPCYLKGLCWNLDKSRCRCAMESLRQFVKVQGKFTLDLGCGTGMTSVELVGRGAEVVSLDISKRWLKLARLRFDLAGLKGHLVLADAQYLPFKRYCFDIAICDNVIEHVPKQQALLREICRVLKDSGFLYLATPSKTSIRNILRDPHYLLPAYDVLPQNFAQKYVHAIRKFHHPVDAVRLLSYKQLRKMEHEERMSLQMISSPTNFKLVVEKQIQTTHNPIKKVILRLLHWGATKLGKAFFILFYMDGWDFVGTKISHREAKEETG